METESRASPLEISRSDQSLSLVLWARRARIWLSKVVLIWSVVGFIKHQVDRAGTRNVSPDGKYSSLLRKEPMMAVDSAVLRRRLVRENSAVDHVIGGDTVALWQGIDHQR